MLDEIFIDELGMCDSCINVDINESELSKLRRKQLKELEADYLWEE